MVGCESGKESAEGVIGSVSGFAGAVVADEPRAALAARDVLAGGGSAADAAVALYFTLAVTLPSSAGLGGGGVCLIYEADAERPTALDFLPRAIAGGAIGAPGNVRGMATLHAQYGRLRWSQLLAPAEDLARGTSVSRALARDLDAADPATFADPEMRRVFMREGGGVVDEGDGIRQLDLAGTVSLIRHDGPGAFYAGPLAVRMVLAAQSVGLLMEGDGLRSVQALARNALTVGIGERAGYFAPPPATGGLLRAELLALLLNGGAYASAGESERPHLFIEATKRVFMDRAQWLEADDGASVRLKQLAPSYLQRLMQNYDPTAVTPIEALGVASAGQDADDGASGFIVADSDGLVIACENTMNRRFGIGRLVPGTGVILAAPPRGWGVPIGPMMAVSPERGTVDFVAAASGGPAAATALVSAFLETAVRGRPLEGALAGKRLHDSGTPDTVYYEEGMNESVLDGLSQRGHTLAPSGPLGRVNALWCPDGLSSGHENCQMSNDPRGNGLAIIQAD